MKTGFSNVETEKPLVVRPPVSMRSEMVLPVTNHKGGKQLSIFLNATLISLGLLISSGNLHFWRMQANSTKLLKRIMSITKTDRPNPA